MKTLARVEIGSNFALFNLQSYVGGQLLMLTEARFRKEGGKKNEIWRRGEIESISVDGNHITIELVWVAIKRGGSYFHDRSSTTIDARLDSFYKGDHYSLVVESMEEDLKMVYCFATATDESNIPLSKIKRKED